MPSSTNPCAGWDFTCPEERISVDNLKIWLTENCKKWAFQVEKGESGYIHYQGRVSLKVKIRKPERFVKGLNWSLTSTECTKDDFYVTKAETRIKGPWKNTDEVIYIPRQIREIETLFPWQQKIVDMSGVWDKRTVNCIVDTVGNNGKSIIKTYMGVYKLAQILPFCNDYQDIMRMAYCLPKSTCYLIDMPRAINKDRLFQFFGAVEHLKDGYCFDDRYHFKQCYFDSPNVWIFTNKIPSIEDLSVDRWIFWGIDSDKKLFVMDRETIISRQKSEISEIKK